MGQGQRKYAAVVFGASGFTGKYIAAEFARSMAENGDLGVWAIAGRSEQKLKEVASYIKETTGMQQDIHIELADVKDEESLSRMCAQTHVLINCVGPYRFFGEAVVEASVKAKCHYVDISGEPEFLEKMQLKYNEEAKTAGIAIVGSCAFDSVPADFGVQYLKSKFEGTLTSVESFFSVDGPMEVHYTTFECLVHSFSNRKALSSLRKSLFPNKLKYEGKPLPRRGTYFYSNSQNTWAMPFAGSDASVVRRTQYFLNEDTGEVPVRYSPFMCMKSFLHVMATIVFGVTLQLFSSFSLGRSLLLKFPRFFTFGVFSHEGPSEKAMETVKGKMTFYGQGRASDSSANVSKKLTIYFPAWAKFQSSNGRKSGRDFGDGAKTSCGRILRILRASIKML